MPIPARSLLPRIPQIVSAFLLLSACESPLQDPGTEPVIEPPYEAPVTDADLPIGPSYDPANYRQPAPPPAPPAAPPGHVTLINFDAKGQRLIRFHAGGNNLDAHDGEIERFGDLYYLYGVSYGCGFHWQQKGTPYCGIKVYSSPDLVEWTYRATLFDVSSQEWQKRCNGSTFGCFRPHIAYSAATGKYVLWINVYDVGVGYRVFVSSSPTGPFEQVGLPKLAFSGASVDLANVKFNGDHNLFVDDDGTGYVLYTDRRNNSDIVVERLTPDYLNGTGEYGRLGVVNGEAPTMFRRGDQYYILFSDPTCPYCRTYTGVFSASKPLGPYKEVSRKEWSSCGGQPTHVSPLPAADGGTVYLYQSDLWNDHQPNQTTAAQFWTPLEFNSKGEIQRFQCDPYAYAPILVTQRSPASSLMDSRFVLECEVGAAGGAAPVSREVRFTAASSGQLRSIAFPVYKEGHPKAPLTVEIRSGAGVLQSLSIPADQVTWNARRRVLATDVALTAGQSYSVRFSSEPVQGCYGFAYYSDPAPRPDPQLFRSADAGQSWTRLPERTMKLDLQIAGT